MKTKEFNSIEARVKSAMMNSSLNIERGVLSIGSFVKFDKEKYLQRQGLKQSQKDWANNLPNNDGMVQCTITNSEGVFPFTAWASEIKGLHETNKKVKLFVVSKDELIPAPNCEFDVISGVLKGYFNGIVCDLTYYNKEASMTGGVEYKEELKINMIIKESITPILELEDVIKAIENDPEILNIIKKRQNEKNEEKERNIAGEKIEKALLEALSSYGFKVEQKIYGKDIVISLNKNNLKYSIEVKSTSRESYVSMTPFQAKTAVEESENYALCVILKNGLELDNENIKENAHFVIDIGDRLKDKVKDVLKFENKKEEIADTNEDIDLFYENNLEYKYKISSNIWTNGKSFEEFIEYVNEF